MTEDRKVNRDDSDSVSVDRKNQHRGFRVSSEAFNAISLRPEEAGYFCRSGVAHVEPNNFRRKSFDETSFTEVGVLRNEYKIVLPAEIPDGIVVDTFKSGISHMATLGVFDVQNAHEPGAQILVEKEFHAAELDRRRSRDAANAKHALISSRVISGKSEIILSSSIPPAIYSRTSYTVMRVPLIHGFPLRIAGLTEIRSCHFILSSSVSYLHDRRMSRRSTLKTDSIF